MKRCFIIGNGPSQNNVDLTLLKDEVTFGTNGIHLQFPTFYPTYWAVLDSHYWERFEPEILDTDSHPCIIIGHHRRELAKGRYERVEVHSDHRLLREGRPKFYGEGPTHFSIGNVGYSCLQIAWQKGFRELNVIGFDSRRPRPAWNEHFVPHYGERLDCPKWRGRNTPLHEDIWVNGYNEALKYAARNGGEIWDVSDGGNNVFPKRRFEDSI